MRTFARDLLRVWMRALLAVIGCAFVVTLSMWVIYSLTGTDYYVAPTIAVYAGAYTFFVGAILCAIYGAPLYTFLSRRGGLTWRKVTLVGVIPGLVLTLISALITLSDRTSGLALATVGGVLALCGLVVSIVTHRCAEKISDQ